MKISEVSKLTGLAASTIRYYERAGLMPAPPRRSRWRAYEPRHVAHLKALKAARSMGFAITELRALAGLQDDNASRSVAMRRRLKRVADELQRLKRQRHALLAAAACGCMSLAACPLLD